MGKKTKRGTDGLDKDGVAKLQVSYEELMNVTKTPEVPITGQRGRMSASMY